MTKTGLHNEKILLRQVAGGNEQAFNILFKFYAPHLSAYVFSILESKPLTQEIVQDVFIKIWSNKEHLAAIDHFGNYLFIITRNHTMNALAKIASEIKRKREYGNWARTHPQFFAVEEKADYLSLIDQAIALLPPRQQQVYLLNKRKGFSHKEIGVQVQLTPTTVKRYIYLANQSIIKYVKEHAKQAAVVFTISHFL